MVEKETRFRRANPLYSSTVFGKSYQYGERQLEMKGPRHLDDFNMSIENLTIKEQGQLYKGCVELLLGQPDLFFPKKGTLSKREPVITIYHNKTNLLVMFENNSLYENHHFISSYKLKDPNAIKEFFNTGNIGLSPEERRILNDNLQKERAKKERQTHNQKLFYSTLPESAHISNKQLREVESLKEQLDANPNLQFTEKEENLIQRAKKYEQHKKKFFQDNPDIPSDEF